MSFWIVRHEFILQAPVMPSSPWPSPPTQQLRKEEEAQFKRQNPRTPRRPPPRMRAAAAAAAAAPAAAAPDPCLSGHVCGQVFVGNVPRDMDETQLKNVFER